MTEPKPKRPASEAELQIVRELNHVTFLPGSPDKRFARDMWALSTATLKATGNFRDVQITDAQGDYIRRLAWRYRRQLPKWIVDLGDKPE